MKNKKIRMDISRVKFDGNQIRSVKKVVGDELSEIKSDDDYIDHIRNHGYVFYEGSESDILIDLNYKERVGMYLDLTYNGYEEKIRKYVL